MRNRKAKGWKTSFPSPWLFAVASSSSVVKSLWKSWSSIRPIKKALQLYKTLNFSFGLKQFQKTRVQIQRKSRIGPSLLWTFDCSRVQNILVQNLITKETHRCSKNQAVLGLYRSKESRPIKKDSPKKRGARVRPKVSESRYFFSGQKNSKPKLHLWEFQ